MLKCSAVLCLVVLTPGFLSYVVRPNISLPPKEDNEGKINILPALPFSPVNHPMILPASEEEAELPVIYPGIIVPDRTDVAYDGPNIPGFPNVRPSRPAQQTPELIPGIIIPEEQIRPETRPGKVEKPELIPGIVIPEKESNGQISILPALPFNPINHPLILPNEEVPAIIPGIIIPEEEQVPAIIPGLIVPEKDDEVYNGPSIPGFPNVRPVKPVETPELIPGIIIPEQQNRPETRPVVRPQRPETRPGKPEKETPELIPGIIIPEQQTRPETRPVVKPQRPETRPGKPETPELIPGIVIPEKESNGQISILPALPFDPINHPIILPSEEVSAIIPGLIVPEKDDEVNNGPSIPGFPNVRPVKPVETPELIPGIIIPEQQNRPETRPVVKPQRPETRPGVIPEKETPELIPGIIVPEDKPAAEHKPAVLPSCVEYVRKLLAAIAKIGQ